MTPEEMPFKIHQLEKDVSELRTVVKMILSNLKVTVGREVLKDPQMLDRYLWIGMPKEPEA